MGNIETFDDVIDEQDMLQKDTNGGRSGINLRKSDHSVVEYLISVLFVVYCVQIAVRFLFGDSTHLSIFALSTAHIAYVWTWIISVIAHNSIAHLIGNSLALYTVGHSVLRRFSPKQFLSFFFSVGILSGFAEVVVGFITTSTVFVLGASGAIFGFVGLLAVDDFQLDLRLIEISTRTVALLLAGFSILGIFGIVLPGLAHTAHLTGLVFGYIYGKRIDSNIAGINQNQKTSKW